MGNEKIDHLLRYLNRLKIEIVKDTARVTRNLENIWVRDGGIRAIEIIEKDLSGLKNKEVYVDRIQGEIKKI